jgi:hypothetical protein
MTATCRNPECSADGIEHEVLIWIGPNEPVFCGVCSRPCELVGESVPANRIPQ